MGGNIALVQNGDPIEINIPEKTISLLISEQEMEQRRSMLKPFESTVKKGYLSRYFSFNLLRESRYSESYWMSIRFPNGFPGNGAWSVKVMLTAPSSMAFKIYISSATLAACLHLYVCTWKISLRFEFFINQIRHLSNQNIMDFWKNCSYLFYRNEILFAIKIW